MSRLLGGLGEVLGRGVQERDVDWLAPLVAVTGSEDELAAEHQRVLGRNVFAWESVFTRPDGLRDPSRGAEAFARVGLEADEPDALGPQLALFAATNDLAFLHQHLGRWAVPALLAITHQDSAIYGPIARLALELTAPLLADCDPPEAPPLDLLDDPKTGLRDIADALTIPVVSGWFLSRDDITRLAEQSGCPCGFGGRASMLETLVRSGVDLGRVDEALEALLGEVARWEEAYERCGAAGWRTRVGRMRALLETVASRAALAS